MESHVNEAETAIIANQLGTESAHFSLTYATETTT